MTGIQRNLSTAANRAFWAGMEKNAEEVATWPDWKRAGINVAAVRSEPRTIPKDVFIDQFTNHGNGD